MKLEIVKYGRRVLREQTHEVLGVTPELQQLVADMLETMYAAHGLGLAAPQVGRLERLCVIDIPEEAEKPLCRPFNSTVAMPLVMFNPRILAAAGVQNDTEGCLSFPEIYGPVRRALEVTVQYQDAQFVAQTITVRGLLARAVQHEVEHLDGKVFIEHLSRLSLLGLKGKLRRLEKANRDE